jgi:hypothetical protein
MATTGMSDILSITHQHDGTTLCLTRYLVNNKFELRWLIYMVLQKECNMPIPACITSHTHFASTPADPIRYDFPWDATV